MAISVGLGAVAVKNRVDSYPGLGREAVRVAQIVGPEDVVDVLDVQPSMLDATRQRAQRHRLHNVVTSTADASGRFPYPDATSTPHLMSVLGEIPEPQQTLAVADQPAHRPVTDLQVLGGLGDGDVMPPVHSAPQRLSPLHRSSISTDDPFFRPKPL